MSWQEEIAATKTQVSPTLYEKLRASYLEFVSIHYTLNDFAQRHFITLNYNEL